MDVAFHNSLNVPVLLTWTSDDQLNGTTNERLVPEDGTQHVSFVVNSVGPPSPITFKVFSTDMKEQYLIGGQNETSLIPSQDFRSPETLLITNGVLKPYYVNLVVANEAGQKVTVEVMWDENTEPQTIDIENRETGNVSRRIMTSTNQLPNYEFQIHEYGTDKNLLINGSPSFTLAPSSDPDTLTYIKITPSTDDEKKLSGRPQAECN